MRLKTKINALERVAKAKMEALAVAQDEAEPIDPMARIAARLRRPEGQRLLAGTIALINRHGDRVMDVIHAKKDGE